MINKAIIPVSLCVLVLGITLYAQEAKISKKDIIPYRTKAAELFKAKQYVEAVAEYRKGMALVPNPIPATNTKSFWGWLTAVDSSFVSSLCWNLSWYQLFSESYIDAIRTAKRGIALDKSQALGIQTNLAHAYLFNNQPDAAKALYLGNLGAAYTNNEVERYWDNIVVEDLYQLRDAGIQPSIAQAMIDTILNVAKQKALRSDKRTVNSIAIRAANNKFLNLSKKNFTFTSAVRIIKNDNGFVWKYKYNVTLPSGSIIANSEEIGEMESFDLIRVPSNPKRANYLNRCILSNQEKFVAVNDLKLPLDGVVESESSGFNSLIKQRMDSATKQYPISSPVANLAKMQSFELIPVGGNSVRFRDSEGHFLAVDTAYGSSTLSLSDISDKKTVFELLNLDGTPFYHELPPTVSKKEKYELLRTYTAIAPIGQIENLLGRGYTEDMKDCGVVIDSNDVIESEYGAFNKRYYDIRDQFQFKANVGMLIANAEIENKNSERYVVLQAFNISKVLAFSRPPNVEKIKQSPVKVFISKIYYGWALNYIVQGSESNFSADVALKIKLFNANVKVTTENNSLVTNLSLVGFKGNKFLKDAAILFDKDEILKGFEPLEKPVPIFVEYTVINEFDASTISWR